MLLLILGERKVRMPTSNKDQRLQVSRAKSRHDQEGLLDQTRDPMSPSAD